MSLVQDAYFKLKNVIEEVNTLLATYTGGEGQALSPEHGNVCFASSLFGFSFTLEQFARIYSDTYGGFDPKEFALRLWGDFWFDASTRKFKKTAPSGGGSRAFVHFLLEPLYKMFSQAVGEEPKQLRESMEALGISKSQKVFHKDVKPLTRSIMSAFFGHHTGLVDMVSQHLPSPAKATELFVETNYTGEQISEVAEEMKKCSPDGPMALQIVKLYHKPDCASFDAFGRVVSGTIRVGDTVSVLGEGYTLEDDEDMTVQTVSNLWFYQGRYRVPIDKASAGETLALLRFSRDAPEIRVLWDSPTFLITMLPVFSFISENLKCPSPQVCAHIRWSVRVRVFSVFHVWDLCVRAFVFSCMHVHVCCCVSIKMCRCARKCMFPS